jgi:hypothetical protein
MFFSEVRILSGAKARLSFSDFCGPTKVVPLLQSSKITKLSDLTAQTDQT